MRRPHCLALASTANDDGNTSMAIRICPATISATIRDDSVNTTGTARSLLLVAINPPHPFAHNSPPCTGVDSVYSHCDKPLPACPTTDRCDDAHTNIRRGSLDSVAAWDGFMIRLCNDIDMRDDLLTRYSISSTIPAASIRPRIGSHMRSQSTPISPPLSVTASTLRPIAGRARLQAVEGAFTRLCGINRATRTIKLQELLADAAKLPGDSVGLIARNLLARVDPQLLKQVASTLPVTCADMSTRPVAATRTASARGIASRQPQDAYPQSGYGRSPFDDNAASRRVVSEQQNGLTEAEARDAVRVRPMPRSTSASKGRSYSDRPDLPPKDSTYSTRDLDSALDSIPVLPAASRSSKSKSDKKKSGKGSQGGPIDIIDQLDLTDVLGGASFHHDGPFDAASSHRNRNDTKRLAPMEAFDPSAFDPAAQLRAPKNPYAYRPQTSTQANHAYPPQTRGNDPNSLSAPRLDDDGGSSVSSRRHSQSSITLGYPIMAKHDPKAVALAQAFGVQESEPWEDFGSNRWAASSSGRHRRGDAEPELDGERTRDLRAQRTASVWDMEATLREGKPVEAVPALPPIPAQYDQGHSRTRSRTVGSSPENGTAGRSKSFMTKLKGGTKTPNSDGGDESGDYFSKPPREGDSGGKRSKGHRPMISAPISPLGDRQNLPRNFSQPTVKSSQSQSFAGQSSVTDDVLDGLYDEPESMTPIKSGSGQTSPLAQRAYTYDDSPQRAYDSTKLHAGRDEGSLGRKGSIMQKLGFGRKTK
ncbi:uncharacterized protein L969DRAFT_17105 [Mixia osmundae IAM 14324]|uniref:Uncharacterized protein n=1 Tax=Mixia osmundae (strain CBS 9802 / IAM 14324 / JCM 22182 / KY 12970) TaxID=764103 RepID=G7E8A5_MIXOS|nr:uncharacterized protein L969DRAFT_17105 [Mixia osmundae IAM 14324]KEI39168.1 hypothetical protein L969DRAFT_17105 [Mixia osmundae IAM 14324]GAA99065.1 hypothetical protein E5Q_05754 [Mixia osmundae IAM 14324]